MTDLEGLASILYSWGIILGRPRPDLPVSGSPERTEERMVLEDGGGALWLLEKISPRAAEKKLQIIAFVDHLSRNGFQEAIPYQKATDGRYHVRHEESLFALLPFMEGIPLDRPSYAFEGWRGGALADALFSFRKAAQGFAQPQGRGIFSIKAYVIKTKIDISRHDPGLLPLLAPIFSHLSGSFFEIHDHLPLGLCHGDYHPLNILWGKERILALIDWEFFGIKPEAYDVANMVGCLGMEDPDALAGDLVLSFLGRLSGLGFLAPESRDSLVDLILALRFAWLAEWLRKKDAEMIDLEATYMRLLLSHREDLKKLWHKGRL